MTIDNAFNILTTSTKFHRIANYQLGGITDQQIGATSNQQINASTLQVYERGSWVHLKLEAFNETIWLLQKDKLTVSRPRASLKSNEQLFCFTDESMHAPPFVCGHDTYRATLQCKPSQVVLDVNISGPKKSGRIITRYY